MIDLLGSLSGSSSPGPGRPATTADHPVLVAECTKEVEPVMSHIVSLFAVMNRPSKHQQVGQYSTHTTHEEMMGLL